MTHTKTRIVLMVFLMSFF